MGTRVVVVGAGIAGLAAARELSRRAPVGTEVLVVEGSTRIGGKLRVSPVAGMPVDEGAEAMLAGAPEGMGLAAEVGLAEAVTHPVTTSASVLVDGVARPLPPGTVMGVPSGTDSLVGGGILSGETLARIAAEPDRPGPGLGADEDVAVGTLVAERLGRQVVDRLVDPLLGGVYAGRADLLSLRATVPALAGALAGTASLVAAVGKVRAAAPPVRGPVFATLRTGLGSLPAAVARGLPVRLGLPVREIHRTAAGFRLTAGPVPDPTHLDADAVVVAVPAAKAAGMLAGVAPWAAAELGGIEYASVAIVTLAYRGAVLPPGSGLLVPAGEGRAVKAVTYSSGKWAHLSGGDGVVLRGSVGRYGDERLLHRDDADLADLVAREVGELAGIGADRAPVEVRVTRWGGALPQYTVGHLGRIRRINTAIADVPGLEVCGAAYTGVGVPACIRTAHQAADRVLEFLGREAESRYG